jgi:hypothetical protein
MQVVPAQQPLAQLPALHVGVTLPTQLPFVQVWLAPQAKQARPPVPQRLLF